MSRYKSSSLKSAKSIKLLSLFTYLSWQGNGIPQRFNIIQSGNLAVTILAKLCNGIVNSVSLALSRHLWLCRTSDLHICDWLEFLDNVHKNKYRWVSWIKLLNKQHNKSHLANIKKLLVHSKISKYWLSMKTP